MSRFAINVNRLHVQLDGMDNDSELIYKNAKHMCNIYKLADKFYIKFWLSDARQVTEHESHNVDYIHRVILALVKGDYRLEVKEK